MALYSRVKTWVSNEILTASDLNAEFDNIVNNSDIGSLTGYSANVTEMQTTADPGGVGTESLASSAAEEITRLRYMIKWITGAAQWYVHTGRNLGTGALSVQTDDLATNSVTTVKITDLNVTTGKIADLGVTSGKLAANAVIAGKLADGAVDTTARIADGVVTQAKRATATSSVSSSSGSYSTTSTSAVDVTNLSVTITASGRPVLLMLMASSTDAYIGMIPNDPSDLYYLTFVRTSTTISSNSIRAQDLTVNGEDFPPSAFQFIDTSPGTGSVTYKVQIRSGTAAATVYLVNVLLAAVEL